MAPHSDSPLLSLARDFAGSRTAVFGLVLLLAFAAIALLAPWVSPQQPYDLSQINLMDSAQPPGTAWSEAPGRHYLLGTDPQGRDMLSTIFYGLRISLFVGLASTAAALAIGLALGLLAGYAGGRTEAFIMRAADIQLSFPSILIALLLLALLGQGTGKIIAALVAAQWAYFARTARGAALVERGKEYVDAARLQGLSHTRILLRHLLPNCLPPVIVVAALQVAAAIALEATLSFLGMGLPVTEPSLGLLIANGAEHMLSGKYWMSFFPVIALLLLIVSINLVADRLRDVLNPRLQAQ
jgi:peptide/nickel transport system permease protein